MTAENDKTLEILHDHHKDSFEHIREREKQRDRLFLIVIALLGLLLLQLQYNSAGISEIAVLGAKLLLDKLPGAVILSATWTFFLVLLVRYYQATVVVENQYDYLHRLEQHISGLLGNEKLYRRESSAYLVKKAQGFRTWIWRFYTIAFPAIVILATIRAAWLEYFAATPLFHKLYDVAVLAAALWLVSLYFLRYGFPKLQVSFPALEDDTTGSNAAPIAITAQPNASQTIETTSCLKATTSDAQTGINAQMKDES